MVLGVAVVVIGLVVAIAKPWEQGPAAETTAKASADATGKVSALPSAAPDDRGSITAAVATAIVPHDAWGVRAIVRAPAEQERWVAVGEGSGSGAPTVIGSLDDAIVALGITAPRRSTPLDVRIWRPTAEGGWTWLDVRAIDRTLTGGDLVFWPPGQDGTRRAGWPAGRYRIEFLMGSTIGRIDVAIPSRFERVPAAAPAPAPPGELLPAVSFRPTAMPPGSFAVADGAATSLATIAGRDLDAPAAWLRALPLTDLGDGSVATVWQPRATGLGVVFPAGTWLAHAELRRLAPGPFDADPAPIVGQVPAVDGNAPYALFVPPLGEAWAPGTYEIAAGWTEGGQQQAGAWGIELRPGPDVAAGPLLVAARSLAPYANSTTLEIGTDVRSADGLGGTSCDEPRTDPQPTVLGISHPANVPIIDVSARLSLYSGRSWVVPLRVVPGVVPGMTLVESASGGTLPSGLYRLEMTEGTGLERRTICLGSVPFDG